MRAANGRERDVHGFKGAGLMDHLLIVQAITAT